jgi:hypothetical protein
MFSIICKTENRSNANDAKSPKSMVPLGGLLYINKGERELLEVHSFFIVNGDDVDVDNDDNVEDEGDEIEGELKTSAFLPENSIILLLFLSFFLIYLKRVL